MQRPMSNQQEIFSQFIMGLAASCQVSLGLFANPATGQTEKNLQSAKQTIDLLEILKEKSRGNLTKEEEELFEHVLFECRMLYVEESKK